MNIRDSKSRTLPRQIKQKMIPPLRSKTFLTVMSFELCCQLPVRGVLRNRLRPSSKSDYARPLPRVPPVVGTLGRGEIEKVMPIGIRMQGSVVWEHTAPAVRSLPVWMWCRLRPVISLSSSAHHLLIIMGLSVQQLDPLLGARYILLAPISPYISHG